MLQRVHAGRDVHRCLRGDLRSCGELNWHDQRTYPDTPQRLHGAAEIAAFSERYRNEWADLEVEALEMTEPAPGRVLALTRQSGRGRQSGVPIVIHYWGIWTVQDGQVREVEYFRHRADALAAAGVEDRP